jgi:hypothetical protein
VDSVGDIPSELSVLKLSRKNDEQNQRYSGTH